MRNLITIACLFLFVSIQAQTEIFNNLLQKNVDSKGNVNYANLKKEEGKLDTYLAYLEKTTPSSSWSKNKQKAFWINAYNAYTIKTILNNYPTKSITKIKIKGKTAWKASIAKVGGKTYSLDHIEHQILFKKFFDPRIHVGVNCASGSCPKLHNVAYTEGNIDSTLEKLTKAFVNDPKRNKITKANSIQVSEIFNWFKVHFTKNGGTVIGFINKYSNTKVSPKARVSYLSYDWSLNGK